MRLPEYAAWALNRLESAGYETWAVGGCVRDSLRGVPPSDWDLCTSATPQQMMDVFTGETIVETGMKHGTVTVVTAAGPLEITTYRADEAYSDGRHPDGVRFLRHIDGDLARRDFTVNAMAWHPTRGLYDPFGGQSDLQNKLLRAVGNPEQRLEEDALRVLRAVRFVAQTGFTVEAATAAAMRRMKPRLSLVSPERIRGELTRILCGRYAFRALRDFTDVFGEVLPELIPMFGCAQDNPHHIYDVWEHSIRAVAQVPTEPALRWAMLLHDCGKPACKTHDAKGVGHFYGHPAVSRTIAESITARLRFSNEDAETICFLVEQHDRPLGDTRKQARRRLMHIGEKRFRQLLSMKKGDIIGQGTAPEQIAELLEVEQRLNEILAENLCFSLRQLAVNGRDITALGLYGPAVGAMLQRLLEEVISERLPNETNALLSFARTHRGDYHDFERRVY